MEVLVMTIQWFPGHMTKAKRVMTEQLKAVDMVIELRDARIPLASANPLLKSLIHQKPHLIILTKRDLADEKGTKLWHMYYQRQNQQVLCLDIQKDPVKKIILDACIELMSFKIQRDQRRGISFRPIRAMIVGIPNVGKSTLINRLAQKKVVVVANRPGVTQAIKWITVDQKLHVMDTPGVLWPKFDDFKVGIKLALTGAIKEQILPIEAVVEAGCKHLHEHYPHYLSNRYDYQTEPYDFEALILAIATKFQFVQTSGKIDRARVYSTFMTDLRQDRLGPITWEMPDEFL